MRISDMVLVLIIIILFGFLHAKIHELETSSASDSPSAGQNVSGKAISALQEADRGHIEGMRQQQYETVEMIVTAYCLCEKCCGRWFKDGFNAEGIRITASGVPAKGKLIAAPRIYPFGTIMDVPGYGDGVQVQDRGGVITGNKIDLLFSSHKEALIFGRQTLKVKVYKNN